jgi:hypothetical protein
MLIKFGFFNESQQRIKNMRSNRQQILGDNYMLRIKITIYKDEIRKRLPILLGILVVSSAVAVFSGWNIISAAQHQDTSSVNSNTR